MGKRLLWGALLLLPVLAGCGGGSSSTTGGIQLSRIVGSRYTLTPIPPLPGDNTLFVTGSNSAGQVVGYSSYQVSLPPGRKSPSPEGMNHAFVVSNGVQRPLPTLPTNKAVSTIASGINDAGTIIGASDTMPVAWHGSSISPLSGVSFSDVGLDLLVNNSETIVPKDSNAFVINHGVKSNLPLLSRSDSVTATDLNASGVVVGYEQTNQTVVFTPVVWQNGAIKALSGLPGMESSGGFARGINNQGQIVGSLAGHAVLWQNGQPIDLHKLLNGARSSEAVSINNRGDIVGDYVTSDGLNIGFFLYSHGIMTDMAMLLPKGSGYTLAAYPYTLKINEQGGILLAVTSQNQPNGWALLTPND